MGNKMLIDDSEIKKRLPIQQPVDIYCSGAE